MTISRVTLLAVVCLTVLVHRSFAAESVKENECSCHCNASPPSAITVAATDQLHKGMDVTNTQLGSLHQKLNAIEEATGNRLAALRNELATYYGRSMMVGDAPAPGLPAASLLANVHQMLQELTGRTPRGGQLHEPPQPSPLQGAPSTGGVAMPIPASTPVLLGQNRGAANPTPGSNVPIDFVAAAAASRRRQQQQQTGQPQPPAGNPM